MNTLTINTSLISCNANRSFTKRKETRYLVLHETVSQATARKQLTFFNGGDRGANAHGFIDWTEVLLTLPFDEVGWHVGPKANGFTEGYELCRVSNTTDFAKQWANATQWFARRCTAYGRGADMILSHHEVTKRFGGTDHTDPDEYFAMYGKTVDDFRRDVQAIIDAPTVSIDKQVAEDVIAFYGQLTKQATQEMVVAANYAANAIRHAVGIAITTDLGKPTDDAVDRMEAVAQAVWWTATPAARECHHIVADALRAL